MTTPATPGTGEHAAMGRATAAAATLADVERACERSVGERLVGLCRLRTAALLGNEAEWVDPGTVDAETAAALPAWPTSPQLSEAERAALAFTEQFVMDVTGVDEALVDGLLAHFDRTQVYVLARAVQAAEARQRAMLALAHDGRQPEVVQVLVDGGRR